MAVIVPSGQPTQLVGLPRLSDETYAALALTMPKVLQQYYEAATPASPASPTSIEKEQ